jgi:peptide/nickel transport system ATP-binding protein
VSTLAIRDLVVRVGTGRNALTAVDGVDLEIAPGAAHGLVGESGSGKSTLAHAVVGLVPAQRGSVLLDGIDYSGARGRRRRELRRRVQLVFQDPRASLNPHMAVGEALGEALRVNRRLNRHERRVEVERLLEQVALDPAHARSRPAALSGGQRQRVALARALAVGPELIIADEVSAALDVSVQGSVLNLLHDLRRSTGLSLLMISHNLAIVRYLCDTISVMQLGRIVEWASTLELLQAPQHPYTRLLIDSLSLEDLATRDAAPEAEPPDPLHPPSGCRFRTVCPVGPLVHPERELCIHHDPGREAAARAHRAACHFAPAEGTANGVSAAG